MSGPITKEGGADDPLTHLAYGEGFSMAVCSANLGGQSRLYVVDVGATLGRAPVTCFWCLTSKENDVRLY